MRTPIEFYSYFDLTGSFITRVMVGTSIVEIAATTDVSLLVRRTLFGALDDAHGRDIAIRGQAWEDAWESYRPRAYRWATPDP